MKRLVLSNFDPAGFAFPKESILIEPPHLRQDKSRPLGIYVVGNGLHRKESVMGIVVAFAMQRSCFTQSSKISDHAIKKAENKKFKKDARSVGAPSNSVLQSPSSL
jgi:hypothetical protein